MTALAEAAPYVASAVALFGVLYGAACQRRLKIAEMQRDEARRERDEFRGMYEALRVQIGQIEDRLEEKIDALQVQINELRLSNDMRIVGEAWNLLTGKPVAGEPGVTVKNVINTQEQSK